MSTGGDPNLTIQLNLDQSQVQAGSQAAQAAMRQQVQASQQAAVAIQAADDQTAVRQRAARGRFVSANSQAFQAVRQDQERFARDVERLEVVPIRGATSALQQFGGGLAALAIGRRVLTELVGAFQDVKKAIQESAAASLAYRESLRQIGTLQGTSSDATVRQQLGFRVGTPDRPGRLGVAGSLLTGPEAERFVSQFEGSLPVGLEKGNITRQVADQLRAEAGLRAARQGGDAATAGDLAGIIAQFSKVRSAQQGLGVLEGVRRGLAAGRGDDPVLTRQLLQVAGSAVREGGGIRNIESLSTLVGVASLSAGPEAAGTRVEQLLRTLRSGLGKAGPGSRAGPRKFFQQVGIQENEAPEDVLGKLAPVLAAQEAAGRDLEVFLKEVGFADVEGRRAIVETYRNLDAYRARLKARMDPLRAGAGELAKNREFLRSASGQARLGAAEQDVARVALGAQPGRELFEAFTSRTGARGVALDESYTQQVKDRALGLTVGGGVEEGRQLRVRSQTLEILEAEIKRRGLAKDFEAGLAPTAVSTEARGAAAVQFLGTRGVDTTQLFDRLVGQPLREQAANVGADVGAGPPLPETGVSGAFGLGGRTAREAVAAVGGGLGFAATVAFDPKGAADGITGLLAEIRDAITAGAAGRPAAVPGPRAGPPPAGRVR